MATNDFTPITADAAGLERMLANVLADQPGIAVVPGSVAYTGSAAAASTFDAIAFGGGVALGRGLLLTSGDGTPGLSNTSSSYGEDIGAAGDADLTAAARAAFAGAGDTQDASILSFSFTAAQAGTVRLAIVFGSDEYPEFSDTDFVDIGAVFVNGTNYAYFGGDATQPLSVIERNRAGNFNNNDIQGPGAPFTIEYDGISSVLTIAAPVVAGTNTIKIAVGDTGDGIYDSGLFISNLAFATSTSTGIRLLRTPEANPDGPNLLQTTGGDLDEEFQAGGGNDTVEAGGGSDLALGGEGDDVLNGGPGNDELNGGAGTDTAVYAGESALYTLRFRGGVLTVSSAAEGTDRLVDIEAIRTADGQVPLDTAFTGLFKTTNTGTGEDSLLLGKTYAGPVGYLQREVLGTTGNEAVVGTSGNDFVNALDGDDAVNAGAGNDVIDGGRGSNFLTGGAGTDVFFLDGRGGPITWSTITDWEAGEQLSIWGYRPGVSRLLWVASDGAEGFRGLTLHGDLNADGTIETSVTWAGLGNQNQLPTPVEFDGLLWFK